MEFPVAQVLYSLIHHHGLSLCLNRYMWTNFLYGRSLPFILYLAFFYNEANAGPFYDVYDET